MNLYVLVEGVSVEPKVYPNWISEVNPSLRQVNSLAELNNNNYYIFSGGGYPNYLGAIEDAISDLNENENLDRLIISIDSEDMSEDEKYNEIKSLIENCRPEKPVYIIVQACCFESWCLGNKKIFPRSTNRKELNKFIQFYDVSTADPKEMPSLDENEWNRAQFATRYLSEICQEKGRHYKKSDPSFVANRRFFFHVKKRFEDTTHISTVGQFLRAFTEETAI